MRRLIVTLVLAIAPSTALATPGPDSVVVIANANVPESVALAERYAEARDVPARQVCLVDVPDEEAIDLSVFVDSLLEPVRACLDDGGVRDRIEAAVLMRGLPIRVRVPVGDGNQVASLAAALGAWDSEVMDEGPLYEQEPGASSTCGGGSTCYAARWSNAYRSGPFEPGWERTLGAVTHRPLLVTMLHGRSYEAAESMIDSAIDAEALGTLGEGEMLFMEGADGARGRLDTEYPGVIAQLTDRGFTATLVPFDANLTGRDLASFFVGTASLGDTIEGNTFRPGSLADNLTSFGAAPRNFQETGESQVSIARWVAQGVAGVHGTVAEPLNNCFPSRMLLVDYVDGATLAEAFHSRMPYVYWRNLVLGDPMAAPFAERPTLEVAPIPARVAGGIPLSVEATDPAGRGIAWVAAFLDGVEVARSEGASLEACVPIEAGDDQPLLIVARAAADDTGARPWQPKGWVRIDVDADGGDGSCAAPDPDAGPTLVDAGPLPPGVDGGVTPGVDAGPGDDVDGGCSCRAAPQSDAWPAALALLPLALLVRRRR